MTSSKFLFPLSLAVGCASAAAMPSDAVMPVAVRSSALDDTTVLRARGPAGLAEALAEFDAAPSARRGVLADKVDRVAGQRYAATSRLYWYTDLAQAETAASTTHRPILALRMLGRLDEDRSCANSRLFRATLYANTEVSAFLRDNFVLYWSSERDVPQVTISFGDGRQIATTITGNSAHYVLAADGAVLDVLPGMYAPAPFRAELQRSLALARKVAEMSKPERAREVREYHAAAYQARTQWVSTLGSIEFLPGAQLMQAQRATMSKAYIEVPVVRSIMASSIGELPESDTEAWAALGQKLWPAPVAVAPTPPRVLDDASLALVRLLHDAGPAAATEAETSAMIRRLEQHLVADSALDELRLRPQVHARMMKQTEGFDTLNAYVYASVFHTPAADRWLGLLPRTDFTGLPGDGATGPAAAQAITARR